MLLACLLAVPAARAWTGADPWAPFLTPWFERVGTADGLPHSVTTAVVQDRRGLVWIGTMGGLVRYDGFRMQVYDAQGKGTDLPDAYVRSLLALPDGGVLVGTNAGGLARFDPVGNRFRTYPAGVGGTSDRKIYSLAADGTTGAWIATDRGLDHLDLAHDTITHVDTGDAAAPRNFSVLQDRHGDLWLGNDRGLFVRRRGAQDFVRPPPAADDAAAATVLRNQTWALHEDASGRLWVGSGQAGAAYRDTNGRWHGVPGFSPTPAQGNFATVRAFAESGDGTEWIGTDGSGVLSYRAGDPAVRHIAHDAAQPSSLPGDSIRGLLHDATGNLWVATDLGVAHTNTRARMVCTLLPSPLDARGLADANVHAILVDSRQRIWLGLGNGQIDLIDPGAGTIRHLQLDGSQQHRDVQAFAEMPDGTIWVGTQGLARIAPDTLAITSNVEPRLASQPVLSMRQVDGSLLLGTYVGVYRYTPATGALEHFRHDVSDQSSLASDTVREIARIDGRIWYGTTGGISVADRADADRGFRNLSERDGSTGRLPQDYIGSIATDPDGGLWVATFGGVAHLASSRIDGAPRFRVLGTREGLSSDKVNAVLPDAHGHVWASLSNGVSMIDRASGKVYNLGARDGLHIPSYIYIAAARAPDGAIMFGGLGGLTIVRDPDATAAAEPVPAPSITATRIGGIGMAPGALPDAGEPIHLDGDSRSLRVGFAVLDYRALLETHYSYRMEGFDEGWTDVPAGSPPSAVYTNLPHGEYTLHLRASTRGMRPVTVESTYPVVVAPRWYETLWLRLLVLLLGALLVVAVIHLRTLYLRRQAKRLQRQIDERTRDLQEANARLDQLAGTDELTGIYNRRRFLELAAGVCELAGDGDAFLAVLDLDRFKQINDGHGHLAGDAVIRAVTDIIVGQCAPNDLVGRYGGEELVICMPDCDAARAMRAAERIRDALAASAVHYNDHAIRVTTSIGVAAIRRGESVEQWLSRADAALYEAKRRGRDRVVLAADEASVRA
jgi:diguanylate cyclase (GGDEF)-like protein